MSARDLDTLMSLYGDGVDYLDKGNVSRDVVRRELQEYFDRWPVVKWKVTGLIQSHLEAGSKYKVTFPIAFEVSNPTTKKRVAGTATETEILAPDASGNKKIIAQHEKISSPRIGANKANQQRSKREKIYDARPTISVPPYVPWSPGIPRP